MKERIISIPLVLTLACLSVLLLRTNTLNPLISKLFAGSIGIGSRLLSYAPTKEAKDITVLNKVALPSYVELCSGTDSTKQLRVLLLGNSLLYHPVSEAVGWHHVSGMAASSAEQDYGHLLFQELQRLDGGNIRLRMANLAEKFERRVTAFAPSEVAELVSFKPNVVVLQLGENVSLDKQTTGARFEQGYEKLIRAFKKDNPGVVTICALPFFPSAAKNAGIETAALNTGSFVVDLSHLSLLEANNSACMDTSISDHEKSSWKSSGVGIHPGNIGMANIARQIIMPIKAGLHAKSKAND